MAVFPVLLSVDSRPDIFSLRPEIPRLLVLIAFPIGVPLILWLTLPLLATRLASRTRYALTDRRLIRLRARLFRAAKVQECRAGSTTELQVHRSERPGGGWMGAGDMRTSDERFCMFGVDISHDLGRQIRQILVPLGAVPPGFSTPVDGVSPPLAASVPAPLASELDAGEHLLWYESPAMDARLVRGFRELRIISTILVLMACGAIAYFAKIIVDYRAAGLEWGELGAPLLALGLTVGFAIYFGSSMVRKPPPPSEQSPPTYALTDRRILAIRDWPEGRSVISLYPRPPLKLRVTERPDGRGDLVLGRNDPTRSQRRTIGGIRNPRLLEQLIRITFADHPKPQPISAASSK